MGTSSLDELEVGAVESNDLELRLSGLPAPGGEIALADLAAIAAPFQELATRIGRHAVEQEGPGRSYAAVENATRLRLSGLTSGSTRLHIAYGQAGVLPIDDGLEQRTADVLWEVVSAFSEGGKPGWTTADIDESALRLLDGLGRASQADFGRGDGRELSLKPAQVDRSAWTRSGDRVTDVEVTMVGVLEMVDLASETFRLRDAVGNKIPLRHVLEPHAAATLVDQRVSAAGRRIEGVRGQFRGIAAPSLQPFALPAEWIAVAAPDWIGITGRPGPDPEGGADLTDEEFAELLAAMKG